MYNIVNGLGLILGFYVAIILWKFSYGYGRKRVARLASLVLSGGYLPPDPGAPIERPIAAFRAAFAIIPHDY